MVSDQAECKGDWKVRKEGAHAEVEGDCAGLIEIRDFRFGLREEDEHEGSWTARCQSSAEDKAW